MGHCALNLLIMTSLKLLQNFKIANYLVSDFEIY